ncbi:MAG: hypothetical protein HRT38_06235 [Alteromonadaceae bacterium]|nr:hypothetical protein [Alteromonadaceae bacterium]
MIKVIFIGNRPKVLENLVIHPEINVVKALVIEQPLIEDQCWVERIPSKGYGNKILDYIKKQDFDLCVSAGCSYILPVDEFPKEKTYINCHPSVLPWGKGIHPVNECLLADHGFAGATIHYLTNELDAGDIIEQKKFEITSELDVSLLYSIIFELEAELMLNALTRLIASNFAYIGEKQLGEGSYYSRPKNLPIILPENTLVEHFLKNVRAFSSSNLGLVLRLRGVDYKIFSACILTNEFFVERFSKVKPGDICIKNNEVLVVKFMDGVVYIKDFYEIPSSQDTL